MRIPASPGARRPCPAPVWVCGASSLPPLARALSLPCRSGVSSLRMNNIGSSASEGQRSLLRTQAISLHRDLSPPPRAGCSQQPAAHSPSRGGRRERARPAGRRGSVTGSRGGSDPLSPISSSAHLRSPEPPPSGASGPNGPCDTPWVWLAQRGHPCRLRFVTYSPCDASPSYTLGGS